MNINSAFSSTYLRAADIEDDTVMTIEEVTMLDVNGEQKPALYFVGENKPMILNKTNANTIAQVCGTSETDDWKGKRIALFVTMVDFQGKQTEAIRVKARAPKAAQASVPASRRPAPPQDDDDSPF